MLAFLMISRSVNMDNLFFMKKGILFSSSCSSSLVNVLPSTRNGGFLGSRHRNRASPSLPLKKTSQLG